MDKWSRLALVASAVAVVVAGVGWFESHREIEGLRASIRETASDVAALRRTPIVDITGAPTLGSDDTLVTLIEFSDYECPFCIRHFTQTWPQLKSDMVDSGRVRYVFRDFPVDQLHPAAIHAHEAAHCAREQGKYWEMHNRLFSAPGTHTPQALEQRAEEAGLDLDTFKSCIASGRTTADIRKSADEAAQMGATGTPFFLIGLRDRATNQVKIYQAVTGAQPLDTFRRAVEAVEKRVQK